jgi:hypothetical protein
MNTALNTYGMERCPFCGRVTAHDRVCSSCGVGGHGRVSDAPPRKLVRCPGWGCPLRQQCQRYLEPGSGPSTTLWLEPPYDRILGRCTSQRKGEPAPVERPVVYVVKEPTLDYPQAWRMEEVMRNAPAMVRIIGRFRLTAGGRYFTIHQFIDHRWERIVQHKNESRRGLPVGREANAREAFTYFMTKLYHT